VDKNVGDFHRFFLSMKKWTVRLFFGIENIEQYQVVTRKLKIIIK